MRFASLQRTVRFTAASLMALSLLAAFPHGAAADENLLRYVEKKRVELTEKEAALRQEEERLNSLRKDVDAKIEKYTKLLSQIEEALQRMETSRNENMEHIVKAYEAMPNEEAATRLSALEEATATKIVIRMKSKKAGTVLAAMDPAKAAAITEAVTKAAKKIPTR